MRFALRFLLVFSLLSAVWLTGCGDDEKARQAQAERERIAAALNQQSSQLNQALTKLKSENDRLRDAISRQGSAIDDLERAIAGLETEAGTVSAQLAADRAAAEAGKGWRLWQIALLIVVLIIIAFVLIRLFKPKPFEEDEDEDFSAFSDEDFGFDEEEEAGDEGRPGSEPKA